MSRTDTWMPLYVGDYLADTGRLTTVGHGAYLLILMDYWRNGPPPDDDGSLAAIARIDRKTWDKELRSVIRSFFKLGDDGLLHQKRLDHERAHAIQLSDKRRAAAQSKKHLAPEQTDDAGGPSGPPGRVNGTGNGHSSGHQMASNSSAIAPPLASNSSDKCEPNSQHDCSINSDVNCSDNWEYTRASPAYALPSPSPSKKERTELRSDAMASLADANAEIWSAGLKAFCVIANLDPIADNKKARDLLGRLRMTAGKNEAVVLSALRDALQISPSDPMAWLMKAVQTRAKRKRDGFCEVLDDEGIGIPASPKPETNAVLSFLEHHSDVRH